MGIEFSNNASSLLAVPILAADTSLTITAPDAPLFPQPTVGGDYFYLVIEDRRLVPNLREIVQVTARTAAVFTVVRGREGTTAQNFFAGSVVSARLTAQGLFDLRAEEATLRAAADAAEVTARNAAILVEKNRAQAAEAAEIAARAAAITSEAGTRGTADSTETAARIAADNAEVTARTAAILVETNRALAAEATAASGAVLATEISARAAADAAEVTARNAAIAVETTRALAAEAALAAADVGATALVKAGTGTCVSSDTVTFATPFPHTIINVVLQMPHPSTSTIKIELDNITTPTVTGFKTNASDGGSPATTAYVWIATGT